MKKSWFDGLKEAERLYKYCGYNQKDLYEFLNEESRVVGEDYRWSEWLNGVHSFITHLNDCTRRGVNYGN